MTYEISFKNNGFIVYQKGITTIEEIEEANGFIHGHEEFCSHRYQIINLLDADFSEISHDTSDEPAATDKVASQTQGRVKVAFVVQDPNVTDYCKQYISHSKDMGSPWGFEIFSTMEDALKWVGT